MLMQRGPKLRRKKQQNMLKVRALDELNVVLNYLLVKTVNYVYK